MKLKEIIEELNLFERERVPNDIRILGIATYIQTSSTRRTAKKSFLNFIQSLTQQFGSR